MAATRDDDEVSGGGGGGTRDDQFLLLTLRYFDDDLADDERARLNGMLRDDPALRRRFIEYCTQACLIRETFVPQTLRVAGRRRLRLGVLTAAAAAAVVVVATALSLSTRWDRSARESVAATNRSAAEPPVASLDDVAGVALVTGPGGDETRPAAGGAAVRSGDRVRVRGPGASASLAFADGTRLLLVGNTTVTLTHGAAKRLTLHGGTLAGTVAPQPSGAPMVLTTPEASVEVLGTRFAMAADARRTDVRVHEGRVRLTRTADGSAVEVPTGKSSAAAAVAGPGPLTVRDIPAPPDGPDLDFEAGLPAGMDRARFVSDGLPRGSKGAAGTVYSDKGEAAGGAFFELATHDAWYEGLFAVHDDTHVHFTFRMDKPGWVNVFIHTRNDGSDGSPLDHAMNYLFNDLRFWDAEPGAWRTVSIPVRQFRPMSAVRGEPFEGHVPFMMLFSTPVEDRGLVVDRLWVTRGGPGVVKYQAVE